MLVSPCPSGEVSAIPRVINPTSSLCSAWRSHPSEQKWLTSLPHHRAVPLCHHPGPPWAHPCIPIHVPFGHSIPTPALPVSTSPSPTSPSPVSPSLSQLSILLPPSSALSPCPVPMSPPPCSHHHLQHLGSEAPPQVLCPNASMPRKQRSGHPAPALASVCLHSRSALNIFHLAQCKCLR